MNEDEKELIGSLLDGLTGLMGMGGPAKHHLAAAREQCRHAYMSIDPVKRRRKYRIAREMLDVAIEITKEALENHPDNQKEVAL